MKKLGMALMVLSLMVSPSFADKKEKEAKKQMKMMELKWKEQIQKQIILFRMQEVQKTLNQITRGGLWKADFVIKLLEDQEYETQLYPDLDKYECGPEYCGEYIVHYWSTGKKKEGTRGAFTCRTLDASAFDEYPGSSEGLRSGEEAAMEETSEFNFEPEEMVSPPLATQRTKPNRTSSPLNFDASGESDASGEYSSTAGEENLGIFPDED